MGGYTYYQVIKYYKAKESNKKFFPKISDFSLKIATDPEELNTSNKRHRENNSSYPEPKSIDTEDAECLIRMMDEEVDEAVDFEIQDITDECNILHEDMIYNMISNNREKNCFIDSGCSKTSLKSRKFFQ